MEFLTSNKGSSGIGGTTDYDSLDNQPSINGQLLRGNKTSAQLGIPTVKLNDVSQQNFNFIENKVVPDGLVGSNYFNDANNFTINLRFKLLDTVGYNFILKHRSEPTNSGFSILTYSGGSVLHFRSHGSGTSLKITDIATIKTGTYYDLTVCNNNGNFCVILNGAIYKVDTSNIANYTGELLTTHTGTTVDKPYVYNRALTPQEIQHNFTVLNNSPSINALTVADKKLLLVVPKLYKEKKTLLGTWTEIPYTETRDLTNYNYKFM